MHATRSSFRFIFAVIILALPSFLFFPTAPAPLPATTSPLATLTPTTKDSAYVLPADGPIMQYFDGPEPNWLPGHRGVDIAVSIGQPLLAPAPGTIVFSGMVAGIPVVSIDHFEGIRTTYQPASSELNPGAVVQQGQEFGTIAPQVADAEISHCGLQPCLHWGARTGPDTYIDPLSLIGRRTIRLFWPEDSG